MPAHPYYFAYGSNLNRADLIRYCNKRGFSPDALRAERPAWLLDHRPVYHYRSPRRGGGALDVLPKTGHLTPGVLFVVESEGWDLLDLKEGAPHRYARQRVFAVDMSGSLFEAVTYRVTSGHRQPNHVPPRAGYTALVEEGLREHGLPLEQHEQAVHGAQPVPMVRHLFVDGLLPSSDALGASLVGVRTRCPARTRGCWLRLGGYLAWQPPLDDNDWIQGRLIRMEDPEAALAEIDRLVGWSGNLLSSPSARVVVEAIDPGGEAVLAWCYRASPVIGGSIDASAD